jgi:hypothetical protein
LLEKKSLYCEELFYDTNQSMDIFRFINYFQLLCHVF